MAGLVPKFLNRVLPFQHARWDRGGSGGMEANLRALEDLIGSRVVSIGAGAPSYTTIGDVRINPATGAFYVCNLDSEGAPAVTGYAGGPFKGLMLASADSSTIYICTGTGWTSLQGGRQVMVATQVGSITLPDSTYTTVPMSVQNATFGAHNGNTFVFNANCTGHTYLCNISLRVELTAPVNTAFFLFAGLMVNGSSTYPGSSAFLLGANPAYSGGWSQLFQATTVFKPSANQQIEVHAHASSIGGSTRLASLGTLVITQLD